MKHSSCLFKKFVFVLCFFVLQNLSAMSNNAQRIDAQGRADINFYNSDMKSWTPLADQLGLAYSGRAQTDNLGIARCWIAAPGKVVVLSKDVVTGNFNLLYGGEIKASAENINVSLDEIMGTDNVYPELRLAVDGSLNLEAITFKLHELCLAINHERSRHSSNALNAGLIICEE